ncbi:MAG: SDR family NAD(P)-dependent oxidoreductase [Brevundimonas sp.]|uniref:SDR family NAD(P)-dependent oxidoreductase n=1 Tax=Brevundimonas sp. TaxID=1871086 RepID=UPI0024883004|nr:SDR family oxidoreductase [Brevundimonas sp.]MDI1328518.1 SDR family NAD(P)-dependent oxidoreductase [Brevundimonas sp.]
MRRGVVVTGGSRGIGLATARLFQRSGYEVVSLSRSAPTAPGVEHLAVDITELASVERAAVVLTERAVSWDRTVLIHNAAVHRRDTVSSLTARDLQAVLSANLAAPQALNHELIPVMGSGSSILYVGSTLAEKAAPGAASYVTSKHGMIGLMRATCQDLAGSGVHTACICPGFTDTAMLRAHVGDAVGSITAMITAGRLLEPEEIAEIARFCADSPALNGAVLHANLGQIER